MVMTFRMRLNKAPANGQQIATANVKGPDGAARTLPIVFTGSGDVVFTLDPTP